MLLYLFLLVALYKNFNDAAPASSSVLSFPLHVDIWIAASESDYNQISKNLVTNLGDTLPFYSPVVYDSISGGDSFRKRSDVQFSLAYKVHFVKPDIIALYEKFVKETLATNSVGEREIRVNEIANFLNELRIDSIQTSGGAIFNLPIMILDSKSIVDHLIHNGDPKRCTNTVIANMLFLDLSAKVCGEENSAFHGDVFNRRKSPTHENPWRLLDSAQLLQKSEKYRNKVINRVTGVVLSAIQSLSSGVSKREIAHSTDLIYIPIVVMRHGSLDPIDVDSTEAIKNSKKSLFVEPNVKKIEEWVKNLLLPGQRVVVVTTTHYIDEHPQLAVAFASAQMTYTNVRAIQGLSANAQSVPFIDTHQLFAELSKVGDTLIDQLLSAAGHKEEPNSISSFDAEEAMFGHMYGEYDDTYMGAWMGKQR